MIDNFFNNNPGDWLSIDKNKGVGRSIVFFQAEPWEGREDRIAVRMINTNFHRKVSSFRQLGKKVDEVSSNVIKFPKEGGDIQVALRTNAFSLKAEIIGDDDVVSRIESFTTVSGLNLNVNDTRVNYAFPGDPGLNGVFNIYLIISMPDNTGGYEREEFLSVNGNLIKISQKGEKRYYIDVDKDFIEVSADRQSASINISSNLEDYIIEIIECGESDITSIDVDKDIINLDVNGSEEIINIKTNPSNLSWRIVEL